jgi:class 3 adenylate cyclase
MALSLIYIKYILDPLLHNNITFYQFEASRSIMWAFATPLMLKMYCDTNNITLNQLNFHYHIIPIIINVFVFPYKNTAVYYLFMCGAWILFSLFIKTLYEKKNLIFTNIYLCIWIMFMSINVIDLLQISNVYYINLYYSYADMIGKLIVSIIVDDYNENKLTQLKNIDLQSVQFLSYMIKNIKKYKLDNTHLTMQCNDFIDLTNTQFIVKIPENKSMIEHELLKKILPLNLDKDYIDDSNTKSNSNAKQFDMICILFTDIVNYTELAKKYNDTIIFELLHTIYNKFDNMIKKYPHLQKIETIGDAYMVVGDIFRDELNHKIVIKEMMEFALEIIKEIKLIKTPDKNPLSIRIGINMGNVSIGILGNEIPRLCIVGNAVNVASRLQSTADPDSIQFSKHIYEQLEDSIDFNINFEIVKKENVFLKNIGSVVTYNIYPNI